jgi:4-hydroxy-4-methyl-2-oxoglutarate aldolase
MTPFQRPTFDVIQACRAFPASVLADAMSRTRCMDSGIKPLIQKARICGPALTIRCYPGDNLMCHYGLQGALPGDVLVVDGGGYTEGALWAGLLSRSALQRDVAGTILDGAARDQEELQKLNYPVYARSVTPRGVFKAMKGEINVPISCGNLTVHPGDLVLGDSDGIVVVPRDRLSETLEEARQILRKEEQIQAEIERGKTIFDMLGLNRFFDSP